jgi:hypothetical protein
MSSEYNLLFEVSNSDQKSAKVYNPYGESSTVKVCASSDAVNAASDIMFNQSNIVAGPERSNYDMMMKALYKPGSGKSLNTVIQQSIQRSAAAPQQSSC